MSHHYKHDSAGQGRLGPRFLPDRLQGLGGATGNQVDREEWPQSMANHNMDFVIGVGRTGGEELPVHCFLHASRELDDTCCFGSANLIVQACQGRGAPQLIGGE